MNTGPTVFLDQDALINLYEARSQSGEFDERLRQIVAERSISFVLSPWHWVETARTKDLSRALPLAEFMDSLGPTWLRDRRHLAMMEVQRRFFQFVGIPYGLTGPIVTRSELLSEMNGFHVSPERAPSSREFVEGWIKSPELMEPIVQSYQKQVRALTGLREALALGKVTTEVLKQGDRQYLERYLPKSTPNRLVLDAETKNAFLDQVTQADFPTLAIESEIAEYSWANKGRTDWNSMVDKFHVISSLHYIDIVVSDDRFFYLLLPQAQKTGYVRARVTRFSPFCIEFSLKH
jgi:hypothetical protein